MWGPAFRQVKDEQARRATGLRPGGRCGSPLRPHRGFRSADAWLVSCLNCRVRIEMCNPASDSAACGVACDAGERRKVGIRAVSDVIVARRVA